ncbi:MAG: acyl-CoA dehydrogenase family protein [Gammaproteobacteria bacterium]|nr:acyl-CoA dehydrogenase family protein [Gammaproteobacteria bacterium]MBK8132687.1 acyl-CoA dehydrogenase family protein [Gammaproteobacteria bacterium]MBK9426784.1 acyl-CoA dehydrogenase family protein [Gammaproteobacteria bacterium]
MPDLEQFRRETRIWLEANCPLSQRESVVEFEDRCWGGTKWKFTSDDQKRWLEVMAARGWTAPDWPAEYGGGGLNKEETKILREEMNRINARVPLFSMGLSMIGPALLKYGSEALKRQHIRNIVEGRIWWCQGYSEPNFGSDLAGLQTRCEDKGDHFIVNGQKVWTSYADRADWMFCLVRTDPAAVKHAGISLVLFDMNTPGVTTRPIRLISGKSPFCETFLDDVRVEKDQLVGTLNKGWELATYLLTHEREMIGSIGQSSTSAKSLHDHAVEQIGLAGGALADSVLRTDIARWEMDNRAFELTAERITDEATAGQGVGAASSMLKYTGTEINKRRHELLVSIHGQRALAWEGDAYDHGLMATQWLRTKGNSIEGGTSEIQLNIIAKRILGLGKE